MHVGKNCMIVRVIFVFIQQFYKQYINIKLCDVMNILFIFLLLAKVDPEETTLLTTL